MTRAARRTSLTASASQVTTSVGARAPDAVRSSWPPAVSPYRIAEDQKIQSTSQVAAVTRPLWSVSEIMDNTEEDSEAVFRRHEGLVRDGHGRTISKFRRKGGLYVGLLRMRNPKFQGVPTLAWCDATTLRP